MILLYIYRIDIKVWGGVKESGASYPLFVAFLAFLLPPYGKLCFENGVIFGSPPILGVGERSTQRLERRKGAFKR